MKIIPNKTKQQYEELLIKDFEKRTNAQEKLLVKELAKAYGKASVILSYKMLLELHFTDTDGKMSSNHTKTIPNSERYSIIYEDNKT